MLLRKVTGVRLTADELTTWAADFYAVLGEKLTWTKLSNDAGFRSATMTMQRTRNEVDAQVVINVSRHRNFDPLEQLGKIPRWKNVSSVPSKPTHLEVVASLNPAHVYGELADRLLMRQPRDVELGPWDSYYARMSSWVDAAGPENARETIRAAIKLRTSSTLSGKLNSRSSFDVDEVIDGFSAAGMDSIYALVLAGKISAQEAGYSETIRNDALVLISDEDLLLLSQKQGRYTSRILMDNRISQEHLRSTQR